MTTRTKTLFAIFLLLAVFLIILVFRNPEVLSVYVRLPNIALPLPSLIQTQVTLLVLGGCFLLYGAWIVLIPKKVDDKRSEKVRESVPKTVIQITGMSPGFWSGIDFGFGIGVGLFLAYLFGKAITYWLILQAISN